MPAPTPVTSPPQPPRRRRLRGLARRVPLRYWVFAVLVTIALGVLGWLLSWASPIQVREVAVVGADGAKRTEVLDAAAIAPDTPIRDIDTAAVTERVIALPGIEAVDLDLQRPWTVVVRVVERFPFAVVAHEGQWTVVDASGAAIRDEAEKRSDLPEITGDLSPALQVLSGMPAELRGKVRKVVAADGVVALALRGGTLVNWGPAGQDAEKAQVVSVLLQYRPTGINVSVPERPTLIGDTDLPKDNRLAPDPDAG